MKHGQSIAPARSQGGRQGTDIFDCLPDAVLAVGPDGLIVRANRQCFRIFGYAPHEIIGEPVELLIPPQMRERHAGHRRKYMASPTIRQMGAGLDLKGYRKDGSEIAVDIMLSPLPGTGGATLAVIRDVSEMLRIKEQLSHLAFHDDLTGLLNRAALYRDLNLHFAMQSEPVAPLAIILFDLDKFKVVNDTLGHSAGDELLRTAAARMAAVVKQGCRLYRLGGDEFMIVLPNCAEAGAAAWIVEDVQRSLVRPFHIAGRAIHVSCSAGIAVAPSDGNKIDDLLANADLALYQAKAQGLNRSQAFHDSLRAEIEAKEQLVTRLRQALGNDGYQLYFQPVVRLDDGEIVGAEALLRLHDNGRVIAPAAFMEVLESCPIAQDVGDWIIVEACKAVAAIRRSGHPNFWMAINLFACQLEDPILPNQISALLEAHDLLPNALHIEITETVALKNNQAIITSLSELRSLGIALAFDDFGTGYASLSLLTDMPLSHLKIDSSFIRNVPENRMQSSIVRFLIEMAGDLDILVVAEGVENAAQERFLRNLGCPFAQGYRYGRPLPTEQFERLVANGDRASTKPKLVG